MPKEICFLHIQKFVKIWSLIWQLGMRGVQFKERHWFVLSSRENGGTASAKGIS